MQSIDDFPEDLPNNNKNDRLINISRVVAYGIVFSL